MWTTNRRTFLAGCAALAFGASASGARASGDGLGALAERSGRFFGAALTSAEVRDGGAYLGLLEDECSVWVPEWELKWGALVHEPTDEPNYAPVDVLVAAAKAAGKRMRGHTLIWHEHIPDWVAGLETNADWERDVAPHITSVAKHYADAFTQWDVVNEAIDPDDGGSDLMRRTPFYRMLGPDYVAEAFRLAAAAAPNGRLYLNDYNVCYDESWQEKRRKGVLKLLERLIGAGVPVHGFGIQGHLDTRFAFKERVLAKFIAALEDLGLEIAITELDVREADTAGGASIAARRQRAADEVEKVLAVVLDSPALSGVVTWGLADSYSWLRSARSIPDNQGLPYNDTLSPAPMRETLARLFAGAPTRHD